MENLRSHPSRNTRPVVTQTQNNTTLWIGHLSSDPTDHFAGQTFQCPSEGVLDNIQVFSSAVQNPGEMLLTLHEFDPATKTWGPSLANSSLELRRGDDSRWVRFELQPVFLRRDITYGFQLHASDAFIGLGEAATVTQYPFTFGQEWKGDSQDREGHYFRYFSLAFKVELCA
ncbi:MAG TPA: hypothetical protein VEB63_03115 [Chitinophagaceae bacterium]|nr:hypothetical protein [Chitinophagaceae bacterium]